LDLATLFLGHQHQLLSEKRWKGGNVAMAALGDDLLATVNKLQDLVFNTIGNDSLDLPQIVCMNHTRLNCAPRILAVDHEC